MEFNSLEEMIEYIEKAQTSSIEDVGEKMIDIMKEETDRQVYKAYTPIPVSKGGYGRTNDLMKSIGIVERTKNSISTEWQPNGNWYSVITGNRFYAIRGLEGGHTWGRQGTDLLVTSYVRMDDEVPNVFRNAMKSKGIPIE